MSPAALDAVFQQAAAAHARGDTATAARLCREILAQDEHHLRALFALASLEFDAGHHAQADAYAARVVAIDPAFAEAHNLRGMALVALKRTADAADAFGRAAHVTSEPAPALYNQGTLLYELGRYEEALRCYDAALAGEPRDAIAHNNRGNTLRALNRFAEALAAYDRAVALDPAYADAWSNRGIALQCLGRGADALASYDRAVALAPHHAEAYYNRGITLAKLDRLDEARASHDRAVALQPAHADAAGAAFALAGTLCDWHARPRKADDLASRLAAGQPIAPFLVLAMRDDPALQAQAAAAVARGFDTITPTPITRRASITSRIRIAYLSADFRNHVVGHTLADLIARSDRSRFELTGVALTPAPDSPIGRRLVSSFDHFIDAAGLSDAAIAATLRERGIDIAVDLMGYTEGSRMPIFAHRAAPLQINYFGYPGTSGTPFIDYLIADRTVVTPESRDRFSEKVVYLPDCYLATDTESIGIGPPSRRELELPETGFVFCSFSASFKITPELFNVWMRLLAQIERSVLWLYAPAAAQANLRREAARRGVAPERLVFAPPVERAAHLARMPAADLFLDTLPYNAHNTAAEALWAGLPLITGIGRSFPARVAASVLSAAGLPELVTHSLAEYETLALELASDRARLAALRTTLAQQRGTCALFDAARYRRHLEAAYATMWARHCRGEAPEDFAVEPV